MFNSSPFASHFHRSKGCVVVDSPERMAIGSHILNLVLRKGKSSVLADSRFGN